MSPDFSTCAEWITQADGLLITAGAGMGIDSGLPDFRGPQGFWGVYPALGRARVSFERIANPAAFVSHPRLAWGFYGHRLTLYRATVPHPGFHILRRLAERLPEGGFVFTSNVDGQFGTAGFAAERISECHGSIHYLQCLAGCSQAIWPADDFRPELDEENGLLVSDFPVCPRCRGMARPNILMFGDGGWVDDRAVAQDQRLRAWLRRVERLLVIEVGAGTHVPTVRRLSESVTALLIRINPHESQLGGASGISIPCGGLDGLRQIEARITLMDAMT